MTPPLIGGVGVVNRQGVKILSDNPFCGCHLLFTVHPRAGLEQKRRREGSLIWVLVVGVRVRIRKPCGERNWRKAARDLWVVIILPFEAIELRGRGCPTLTRQTDSIVTLSLRRRFVS